MSPGLILLVACAAVLLGVLLAIVGFQDRILSNQQRTISVLERANKRQRAATEIARAELLSVERQAQIITFWRTQTHERRTT